MDRLKEFKSKHMSKTPVGAPPGKPPDGMSGSESDSNTASFGEILIFVSKKFFKV